MTETPYKSFWMGGFEGADHINAQRNELDMVRGSGHLSNLRVDYRMLRRLGIKTVRESIGWRISQPTTESPINMSRALSFARAAKESDVQIIWTFMHYGTPTGVDITDDSFVNHFVKYVRAVATALKPFDAAPVFNLINEISFLAWALSQTDFMWPYVGNKDPHVGYQIKCRLVKAVLEGMIAVKEIIPAARFIHVEPLLHVAHPEDRPDLAGVALEIRGHQWQAWELLRGNMEPHLGGFPAALDLVGVNYYHNGQMEIDGSPLSWSPADPRRVPFSELLSEIWQRYKRPIIISETGHMGNERHQWLTETLSEVLRAQKLGVVINGVCIYPVVDRPCWHNPSEINRVGVIQEDRTYHYQSVAVIRKFQSKVA